MADVGQVRGTGFNVNFARETPGVLLRRCADIHTITVGWIRLIAEKVFENKFMGDLQI